MSKGNGFSGRPEHRGIRVLFSNQVPAPEGGRPALKSRRLVVGGEEEQAVEVQFRDRQRQTSREDVSQRWARRGGAR